MEAGLAGLIADLKEDEAIKLTKDRLSGGKIR